MAAAPHADLSPPTGEDIVGHNSTSNTMDWHGLYQELLFRRAAANPPSSGRMGTSFTNTAAARTAALPFQEKTSAHGIACEGDSLLSAAAVDSVQDFLSENPKANFEEGEDEEGVLMMLCNGLREFFEAFDGSRTTRERRSKSPHAKAFNALLDLLLRTLLHRDRELKMAAISAFGALLSASDITLVLQNNVLARMLELSEDERVAFRQVAALALPATLHYARRCAAELHSARQTNQSEQDADLAHAIFDSKQRLRLSYVRLCGDKNSAVQLAAGQQLPLFVDYIAEEVAGLQHEQASQQKRVDGPVEEDAASNDADIGELMISLYTATQKFTLSPNESCRMQGVAAVAAMARRNANVFNALGNNFFPMLCSDSSWRVRAATCLALEDLALLSSESTTEAEKSAHQRDATAAQSRMPSLLFKFLTDRSPLVKIAALQQLQRTAKLLNSASFVRDSWILELQQIGEDDSVNAASRLPGACLDAVVCILELAEGDHRRTLVELAMDLAQESFAWDEEGDDCWRIHAATAQQLPAFLLAQLGKGQEDGWWERCHFLLVHPGSRRPQSSFPAAIAVLGEALPHLKLHDIKANF
ncbi:hypothetical protein ACSSS7_006291 [Eimeria intestinalis]